MSNVKGLISDIDAVIKVSGKNIEEIISKYKMNLSKL
jgi:hypothetical protein